MGNVLEILAKVTPEPLKGLFHDSMRFESSECIHIHWRNLRLVLTGEQFRAFARACSKAVKKWSRMGEPINKGDIVMVHAPVAGPTLLGDTIAIEVNGRPADEPDHIHVHYKDLRLEMLDGEFLQLADAMTAAATRLREHRIKT